MTSEYTPTTDEVIRSFSIPAHRIVERKDGESFADYMARASIEGHKSQMESEAAARRWLAEHDAQLVEKLADDEGLHSAVRNAMNERGPYAPTASKGAEDWLRARAAELREGAK